MQINNLVLRPMTLDDFYKIENSLYSNFDDFWSTNTLKDELQCDNSTFIVAIYNNEIVGFAGIKIIVDCADIMNIVVKKNYRNMHIGNNLMKKLIDLCKKLHLKYVNLEVSENNIWAIKLYETFEFKKIYVRKAYYGNVNAIIMSLEL